MGLLSIVKKKPVVNGKAGEPDAPSSDAESVPSVISTASTSRDPSPSQSDVPATPPPAVVAAIANSETPVPSSRDGLAKRLGSATKEAPHTVMILKKPYDSVRDYYVMEKELGRGQYGVIRLCTEKATGKSFACKSINKGKLTGVREVEDVQREVKVMEILRGHPAIIELHAAYEDMKVRAYDMICASIPKKC